MPQGKGTYGSKVGRPKAKKTTKKTTKKKAKRKACLLYTSDAADE